MPTLVYDLAGLLGVALGMIAYLALQLGRIPGDGFLYPFLNLVGAALMLVSLWDAFNLWSALVEISWVAISVLGLARLWILTRDLRFTPEERGFLDSALPGLSRVTARRFLDAGRWDHAPVGTVLTREGSTVAELVYIARGSASVRVSGTEVATCPAGLFVGELGVLSGAPATATVLLSEPSRLFSIPAASLSALVDRHLDLRLSLDAGIGADARRKIVAGNRRIAELSGGIPEDQNGRVTLPE